MLPTMYTTRNQGWLPTIFNDFFNDEFLMPTHKFRGSSPAINVTEDDKEYRVEVAAPGMTKDDFNIKLTADGDIVISMEKKVNNNNENDNDNKSKKYLRREFSYSKFEQTLTLPENVEKEKITASMTDGVLAIDLPKMTEEKKAEETKFIEIK